MAHTQIPLHHRGGVGARLGAGVRRLISRTFRKAPPAKRLASSADMQRLRAKFAKDEKAHAS